MNIFNLKKHKGLFVEAMGEVMWKHRGSEIQWWTYDELVTNPPDDWKARVNAEPALFEVLREAYKRRALNFKYAKEEYGLSPEQAKQFVITYIGYNPSFGAYIAHAAPYFSRGEQHGTKAIVKPAIDKFVFAYLRRVIATPQTIKTSMLKHIEMYFKKYNIKFEPSDFQLVMRSAEEPHDVERQRQKDTEVVTVIGNLDDKSQEGSDFYSNFRPGRDVLPPDSTVQLTPEGNLKMKEGWTRIMQQIMGPWYQEAIKEQAARLGVSVEKLEEMIEDPQDTKALENLYNLTYLKWETAKKNGEAAALGIGKPPKWRRTFSWKTGQRKETKAPTNDLQLQQFQIKKEILDIIEKRKINEPAKISEIMNADPVRIHMNTRRRYKKNEWNAKADEAHEEGDIEFEVECREKASRLEPIDITPDEVTRQINEMKGMIALRKNKKQQFNITKHVQEVIDVIEHNLKEGNKEENKWGYPDQQTTIDMMNLYFAGRMQDPTTRSVIGELEKAPFYIPEGYRNYSQTNLKELREGRPLAEIDAEIEPAKGEVLNVTEGEIEKDIGKEKSEAEKKLEEIERKQQESKLPTMPELPTIPGEKEKKTEAPDEVPSKTPAKSKTPSKPPSKVPVKPPLKKPPKVEDKPDKKPKKKVHEEQEEDTSKYLYDSAIRRLIIIAEDLDKSNKPDEAEEVHKVIRKYIGRI